MLTGLSGQSGEIVALTPEIGSLIDPAENSFYRIFPDVKGFKSAQIYQLADQTFLVKIIFVEYAANRAAQRRLSLMDFVVLQNRVGSMGAITPADRNRLEEGFTYLHTRDVLAGIPENEFVTVKHRGGRTIRGTLLQYRDPVLEIQTPFKVESIPLWQINSIAYRSEITRRPTWSKFVFFAGAGMGLGIAELWNENRRPNQDMIWYNRLIGVMLGALMKNELQQIVETIFSPKSHFALTEPEQNLLEKIFKKY